MTSSIFVWRLRKCSELKVLPKNHNKEESLLVAEHPVLIKRGLVRDLQNIRRDYVEMSNKKDYKIFRRTSKVLTRDIAFREVTRTLILLLKINEDEIGRDWSSGFKNIRKTVGIVGLVYCSLVFFLETNPLKGTPCSYLSQKR